MMKRKRMPTPPENTHKKLMREKYEWVFMNGKLKRNRREPMIKGMPADEFIRRNAGPIWLLQNERYEELHMKEKETTKHVDEEHF